MSRPTPPRISAAARALGELLREESQATEARGLEGRLAAVLPTEGDVPLESGTWLARGADAVGLRLLVKEARLAEVQEWLKWGDAALTSVPAVDGGDSARWVVLRRRPDERVQLTFHDEGSPEGVERVVDDAEVEGEIGGGSARIWLLPEPSEPAQPAAAISGSTPSPLRRLVTLFRPDRRDLAAVGMFAIAIGVLLLATPIAVQALVNFVALGGAIPPLIVVALFLFLGLGLAAGLSALQVWTVELLQRRIFVRMVADLSARLPRVAARAFDKQYGPELVNRFFDIVTIQKVGSFLLLDGLSILLSVLVGLVVLAFYHPLLLAFDILLLAAIAVIVLGPVRHGTKTAIAESSAKYAMAGWLEEIARNPNLFKSSGALRWVYERSDALARNYLDRRAAHFRIVFGQSVSALLLQVLASTALLGIGGLLVIQGSLTLGQLVAAELIVTLVVSSVAKTGKHIEAFYDLMAASDKVGKLLDLPVEPRTGELHLVPASAGPAEVELRSVGVRHADGGEPVFEDVSVRLAPGEGLVVRGASGAGKSTLLEILWGLRRPASGAVRIDGRDVRDLSLESLRRTATYLDGPDLVEGTVRENVRLARPFVTDDDARDALRSVGLLEELEALPQGLETQVTPQGSPLSRGQAMRLCVARAIAGRPRVLLLSTPLAELSETGRRRVFDAVFDPAAPWTPIVASNDPEALARAHQVLELPAGAVSPGPAGRPLSA